MCSRDLPFVKVGIVDVDGVMRGKYMAATSSSRRSKRASASATSCSAGIRTTSSTTTRRSPAGTAYPDAPVRILPETMRLVPFENDLPFFLGEFVHAMRRPACPRGGLRASSTRAKGLGFAVSAAAEFEFFLFEETPHSVREKGYRDLKTVTPGFFGYSLLRAGWTPISITSSSISPARMDFEIEGHTETGPGVLEAAIRVDDCAPPTRRLSSRPTPRSSPSGAAGWRPSWPSGRGTGRASPATCTCRCAICAPARAPSTTRTANTACRRPCAGSSAGSNSDARTPRHGRLHGELLHAAHPASGLRPIPAWGWRTARPRSG